MTIAEIMPFSVLLPLIGAPACAMLPGRRLPWLLCLIVVPGSLVIAGMTLDAALDAPLQYAFGNWPPPIGIAYRVDAANAFVAVLLAGIATALLPWARRSVNDDVPDRQGPFYALFLLALAGLMGITMTGDVFNVFVFLEISSLASYGLIAYGRDRRALLAAFRYLIMGTVGATFLLIGIGFLYIMTGTLNMVDLAERLPAVADTRTIDVALAFIIVGLALKLALVPLHLWLPAAYTYAPSFVSAFLAATATKVALYVMLRFIYTVFQPDLAFVILPLAPILLALALAAMLSGSWKALFQEDAKRVLAYSSIAQIGYMVLGVGLVTAAGLTASLLHMFNHGLIKAALFMGLGTVAYQAGSVRISRMRGLGREMPWTFTALALAGLSLVGLPPTAGFISKWYLINAALDAGQPWLVAAVLIASLMAVVYVGRVLEAAFMQPRPTDAKAVHEAPLALLLPLWLMVGANFYFGLDTRLTVGAAEAGARALMAGSGG